MKMLVGGDDRRRYLGSLEQLPIVGSDEIGAKLVGDELCAIRLDLREPDEVDLGMSRRDFSTKQSDPAATDDGETDALGIFPRQGMPQATARPSPLPLSPRERGFRLVSA